MKSHESPVAPPSDADANGKSRPLSEQAFSTIRRSILRGEIAPGTKLRMEVLQQQHAFSSSPLREALNRLVAEGLVTADDNRGFRVAPMSPDDLADLTSFRLLIEAEALTRSMARGDDAWEGRVVAAYHQLERLEKRGDAGVGRLDDEWTERHKAFHMTLLSAAGSPRLLLLCSNLFDQSERYRRFSAMNRNKPRNTQDEHRRMMEAALERKTDLASAILRDHISQTARNVMLVTEQDSR